MKQHKQDERGITHLLVIVIVVIVVAAIAAVGWKVANKAKPTTPTSSTSASSSTASTTASSTSDSSCLAAYHDSNLCKFAANSNTFDKTAYTAKITDVQSGTTSTMTLESDGKGNTDLTGTSGGSTINSITLNGTTYIQNNGSGPWIEYPSGASSPASNPTSNMNIGVGSAGITFKAVGTQACGSLTCYKYQIIDSAMPSATQYALFDNSSYKLREWQYSDSNGDSTTMTVSYQAVNITAPSPVESLSQAE
jgi:cytoskeletal protein RodZ